MESILKQESGLSQAKPTSVISDLWVPGVHESALKYKIPAWIFSAFSLGYTGTAVFLSQLRAKGIWKLPSSPLDIVSQEEFISLPGLPLMRVCEVDGVSAFSSNFVQQVAKRNGPSLKKSEVIIFSTFEELETRGFRECKMLVQEKKESRKVYTVGPLFPLTSEDGTSTADNPERHPCLKFLDGQADSSVLFVAFGSMWQLPPEQMQEIAFGLEASQQSFLCAFHPAKTARVGYLSCTFSVIQRSEAFSHTVAITRFSRVSAWEFLFSPGLSWAINQRMRGLLWMRSKLGSKLRRINVARDWWTGRRWKRRLASRKVTTEREFVWIQEQHAPFKLG
ncbi:hypothetical protein R1flu_017108 [Riccia fluitans]|uniref:Uncharacterized protein n=1 Tax=Riccia fluitans TaxID=41844 RepID=A0ABD1YSP4_9MARC